MKYSRSDLSQFTLLLVEDNPQFLKAEESLLKRFGFNIVTAENGVLAVSKCQKQQFDCIVMDINLPSMKGDKAISYILELDTNKDTPIIALSGHLDLDTVQGLVGNVSKAFTKPADMMEVANYIADLLMEKNKS